MRDDVAPIGLGTASKTYDYTRFNRMFRDIETWMSRVLSVGLVRAQSVAAGTILTDVVHMTNGTAIITGDGDPEGAVSANIGSLFMRRDGGAGTALYAKEANDGDPTGWVAK